MLWSIYVTMDIDHILAHKEKLHWGNPRTSSSLQTMGDVLPIQSSHLHVAPVMERHRPQGVIQDARRARSHGLHLPTQLSLGSFLRVLDRDNLPGEPPVVTFAKVLPGCWRFSTMKFEEQPRQAVLIWSKRN